MGRRRRYHIRRRKMRPYCGWAKSNETGIRTCRTLGPCPSWHRPAGIARHELAITRKAVKVSERQRAKKEIKTEMEEFRGILFPLVHYQTAWQEAINTLESLGHTEMAEEMKKASPTEVASILKWFTDIPSISEIPAIKELKKSLLER